MVAKKTPSDSDLRSLYDKNYATTSGNKQPACIRCKTVDDHMDAMVVHQISQGPVRRKAQGDGGKGGKGGKRKRKLSLNAIQKVVQNMIAEDKVAAIAALR